MEGNPHLPSSSLVGTPRVPELKKINLSKGKVDDEGHKGKLVRILPRPW